MKMAKDFYGIIKMTNKKVKALGCACYCICMDGDDAAQVGTNMRYISSGGYK